MTIQVFIESPVSVPLWVGITLVSGVFLYLLCRPFAAVKEGWGWKALLLLAFALASAMVIWVGDNNLLFTLLPFVAAFLLCTRGDRVGRLAVSVIFFCLMMAVCGLIDTYLIVFDSYDVLTRLVRPAVFCLLYLGMRGSLPDAPVQLPRRLWRLVLGLAAMPLCALVAVVLLTAQKYESAAVDRVAMSQGAVVLPFVLLTALVLLRAVLVLADHERLEQSNRLAELRAVYYEGLQREQTGVRALRHDLRNHLTALRGLLERGETGRALDYLDRVADAPALRGARRFCENETAASSWWSACRYEKGLLRPQQLFSVCQRIILNAPVSRLRTGGWSGRGAASPASGIQSSDFQTFRSLKIRIQLVEKNFSTS